MPKILVGTSGWSYRHWKGIFYPEDIHPRRWLEFYTEWFSTVEINSTFYRMPKEVTFKNWYKRTKESFFFSVKAHREITHLRRFGKGIEDSMKNFYQYISLLKEKIWAILFQLPPSFVFDEGRFVKFIKNLRDTYRTVIEPRHKSWFEDRVLEYLKNKNIALCLSDSGGRFPYLEEITADFVYIRLHGPTTLYNSSYSISELEKWAEKIVSWNKDTAVYFDNDYNGYAVKNAMELIKML